MLGCRLFVERMLKGSCPPFHFQIPDNPSHLLRSAERAIFTLNSANIELRLANTQRRKLLFDKP
jgi:hypothetical protein